MRLWRASSIRSRPNGSCTATTRHATMRAQVCSITWKCFTTGSDGTHRLATRPRYRSRRCNRLLRCPPFVGKTRSGQIARRLIRPSSTLCCLWRFGEADAREFASTAKSSHPGDACCPEKPCGIRCRGLISGAIGSIVPGDFRRQFGSVGFERNTIVSRTRTPF